MNRSNLEHVFFALLMQLVIAPFFGLWAGACFATGFFLSREHAQREKQIANHVDGLSPLAGFSGWSKDAWMDFAAPAVAVFCVALIFEN